jgi:hypothetical protein
LDLGVLKKMCGQFKLCQLEDLGSEMFPEEAIKCSLAAIDLLNVLHGEVQEARNACE